MRSAADVAGQRRRVVGHRLGRARRVGRIGAGDHRRAPAPRRRTVRVERADLIERRRERDQAVARHAAVGRLQADDAAERRRLADRAAGVGAERERRHAARRPRPPIRRSSRPACDRAPTDCAPARTPSSRSTSPSRTRRSWSCRRSPRRPLRAASTTVASYGGTNVLEDPRRGGRADAARAEVVLERDRHAGQRRVAPSIADRDRSPRRGPARARAVTVLNACSCGSSALDARRAPRGRRRPADALAASGSASRIAANRSRELASSDDPRHPEEAGVERRRRARWPAPSSRSSDGRTSSGRSAAWRVDDAGGRRHAGRVDLLHLLGVAEDVAELAGEQLDLRGVELEVARARRWLRDSVPREMPQAWQMLAWAPRAAPGAES